MARTPKKDFVVGLDIGTTKICAIVGELTDSGIEIISIGTHPSTGLRKGVVINIESTVNSITKAVEQAEEGCGFPIKSAYVGIAGGHIKSFNSHGIVAVKDKEVTPNDVQRVLEAAKAVAIPMDREVIHSIPQEYIIDDQDGIKEPVGMSGVRLEAKVHIVTAAVSSAQNIIKCCNKAGLGVAEIVLEPIASAEAVLTQDEKELGVVLVDIGGGTSDIVIYSQGALVHTGVLAIGGNHVTNDIAVGLRTPQAEAEKIKVRYGCAMSSLVQGEDTIDVPSVGGRKARAVPRKLLAQIIEPRIEEMFSLIQREIAKSGYQDLLASGIVLTGGSCLLDGMPELAEFVFDMPVKRGVPVGTSGLVNMLNGPQYATGVGLLKYGIRRHQARASGRRFIGMGRFVIRDARNAMRNWIKDLF
ncbi:MAG: cell division protein FtsA [Bacteriovoracia bacterium]